MNIRISGIILIVCVLIAGIILQQTSPVTSGPIVVLFLFLIFYVASLIIASNLINVINFALVKYGGDKVRKKPFVRLSSLKIYYYSSVIALAPILLLGLQSVGGVGFYEFFLVLAFVLIGCLYVSRQ